MKEEEKAPIAMQPIERHFTESQIVERDIAMTTESSVAVRALPQALYVQNRAVDRLQDISTSLRQSLSMVDSLIADMEVCESGRLGCIFEGLMFGIIT